MTFYRKNMVALINSENNIPDKNYALLFSEIYTNYK